METPVTDTTKLPFDFEAFACTVFCAFVSHGDNNEAAMRSALTEAGFDALLAKSDRADALEAENARLRELVFACYAGLGGECDLPEPWLDALSHAGHGEPFSVEGLLPFTSSQRVELAALKARIEGLVEKWRSELITVPPPPNGGSAKSYNCALTATANELAALLPADGEGRADGCR